MTEESQPLILDGGMGRELKRRGAAVDEAMWSARALLGVDRYARIARGWLDHGVSVIGGGGIGRGHIAALSRLVPG